MPPKEKKGSLKIFPAILHFKGKKRKKGKM